MVVGEETVDAGVHRVRGEGERVLGAVAKRWQQYAEFHDVRWKATRAAPIAPERAPNIDGVTVIAGRARYPATRSQRYSRADGKTRSEAMDSPPPMTK